VKGGDAAALVGGIAAITIFLAAFAESRSTFLERSAEHVVDGLVFAFKTMGVVLPIAGFFFIGNGDFSGQILGIPPKADGSPAGPAFLYDLVLHGQQHLPENSFVTAFGILVIGMIAGLEGSGFSGLPLTGSLSGSLGHITGIDPATLAAVGQMGNIWSGGGTLVAWSSLIAVAGFARVPVIELAGRCFSPGWIVPDGTARKTPSEGPSCQGLPRQAGSVVVTLERPRGASGSRPSRRARDSTMSWAGTIRPIGATGS
jgi:hypothetical protein